jgi:hypothetical protein
VGFIVGTGLLVCVITTISIGAGAQPTARIKIMSDKKKPALQIRPNNFAMVIGSPLVSQLLSLIFEMDTGDMR